MSMRNQRMDNLSSGGVVPRFMYLSLGFQLMVFAQILLLRQKIQKIVQCNNLALLAYMHIFADTKKIQNPPFHVHTHKIHCVKHLTVPVNKCFQNIFFRVVDLVLHVRYMIHDISHVPSSDLFTIL